MTTTKEALEPPPRWTVTYNIVSPESNAWVGTGWEFFNDERDADACFKRQRELGNVPTKRRFYSSVDWQHLGVADRARVSTASVAPVVDNIGLHCNGCGLLIEGWPNVYRCVTRGCGRIYHYQCLLDHCASDHLCQNCKQSYKPYVLRCDKCGAEAFDCCLSKPCKQCGESFTAPASPAALRDEAQTGSSVFLQIPTCGRCPFVDHSGSFTPGGAKTICNHRDAVKTFATNVAGEDRYHWKYRQVNHGAAPPEQCPLRVLTVR